MESQMDRMAAFMVNSKRSNDKRNKQNRIKGRTKGRIINRSDLYRSAAAQIIARYALKTKLNIPYMNIRLAAGERGKPYLEGYPECFFNISHSEEWVVSALDNGPIGIDIEKILPIDYLGISQRYFSQKEFETLMKLEKEKRLEYFYEIWTLKESYVKNTGIGVTSEMNSFTIETNGNAPGLTDGTQLGELFFKKYFIDKDYKMAVCARHNEFPDSFSVVELGTILDSLAEEALD